MNNNIKKIKKPADPNLTIDVKNDELEERIEVYGKEKNAENLNLLVDRLVTCRVLVPARLNEKKQPVPCFIKGSTGEYYLPFYTSKLQIPKEPKSAAIMNMPYLAVNQMAVKEKTKVSGVVVNPFTTNFVIKTPLLEKIELAKQTKKPLTEEQYVLVARRIFESQYLPKKFFEEKEAFVNTLNDEKEAYIDRLFEESYQNKRLYPYLEEDFSVMFMDISDELLVIRVDMPTRDISMASCLRVFLAWNKINKNGRYFTIEKSNGNNILGEFMADNSHQNYGEAPVEGAELQKILDLIQDTKHHTS